ncbi:MAG: recombinase family protein [Acidobacteriota bacterium]|nr:recombinase family protein [Acidobacteriota bacterium]
MKNAGSRRAFGYCRVSSVGQSAEDRDGLVRQETAIKKWAAANNVRIIKWFRDSVSGTKDLENRPALQALMTALHSNGTRLVLIEKLDRLARNLMIQESIIADMQRNQFEIVSVAEPDLCSSDPTRVLLRQMMGAFSEYERKMIVLKLRGARQRAKANRKDYKEGRKPYGDRLGENEVIERIKSLRAAGHTLAKITEILNREKIPARDGMWYPTSISNVLKRNSTQSSRAGK